jgi:GT2 family glycosyltransferase
MYDLTISIVSFNTRELLRACLDSVSRTRGLTFETFVVDNGSRDGSPEMIASEFPGAQLIANADNRGFAAANNLALRRATGRYVVLLNPDTVIYPHTLRTMVAFLEEHSAVGICGPKIMFPDGTMQCCGYPFPTLLREVRQSKNVNRVLRYVVGDDEWKPPTEPGEVDWVDGACLMIRREVIDQIGLLDEQFFLYAEELDWCYNARKRGWTVVALPTVEMVHYQGKSSEQLKDRSLAYLIETKLRYYRKNRGLPNALLVSLVYIAGCLRQRRREPAKSRVKLRAIFHWLRGLLFSEQAV